MAEHWERYAPEFERGELAPEVAFYLGAFLYASALLQGQSYRREVENYMTEYLELLR